MAQAQLTSEGLLWQLFLMVREVMPPTAENSRRQSEWAAHFRQLAPEASGELDAAHQAEREEAEQKAAAAAAPAGQRKPAMADDDDDDDSGSKKKS